MDDLALLMNQHVEGFDVFDTGSAHVELVDGVLSCIESAGVLSAMDQQPGVVAWDKVGSSTVLRKSAAERLRPRLMHAGASVANIGRRSITGARNRFRIVTSGLELVLTAHTGTDQRRTWRNQRSEAAITQSVGFEAERQRSGCPETESTLVDTEAGCLNLTGRAQSTCDGSSVGRRQLL